MEKYRLVIKKGNNLKIGINSYTFEEALERQRKCKAVGIKFIIMSEKDLFN